MDPRLTAISPFQISSPPFFPGGSNFPSFPAYFRPSSGSFWANNFLDRGWTLKFQPFLNRGELPSYGSSLSLSKLSTPAFSQAFPIFPPYLFQLPGIVPGCQILDPEWTHQSLPSMDRARPDLENCYQSLFDFLL